MPSALCSTLLYQSGGVDSQEAYVLTGPVIGMVTDTTARVLVELSTDSDVTCTLKDRKGEKVSVSASFRRREPSCFEFSNLKPDTRYKVSLSVPCPGLIKAGFATLPCPVSLARTPIRLAFVSGNNYVNLRDKVPHKLDLWKDLYRKASKGLIDCLIHLGDNVFVDSDNYTGTAQDRKYAGELIDNRWLAAENIVKDLPPSQWPNHYNAICEIFKGAYRETWNHPTTKQTLANVPNLMVLGDHEICHRFGARVADIDPYTKEYFIACCAYEVYNQYQRNLFENYTPGRSPYDSTSQVRQGYHFHVFGQIGLMLLDVRASATFHHNTAKHPEKDTELPLLGYHQWRDIEFALSRTGYFSACRMLFVGSSTPPCYIGESDNLSLAASNKAYRQSAASAPGAWWSTSGAPELSYLLSSLFDWRAKSPGFREICIVAGGLGSGGFTDISDRRYSKLKDGRLDRMKQITLAPISGNTPDGMLEGALASALGKVRSLAPNHQFKHFVWEREFRSYAIVDVYVDYHESHPEYGVVTKFTAQAFGAKLGRMTWLKPIDSSYRSKGAFHQTFLGLYDGAGDGFRAKPVQKIHGWGDTPLQGATNTTKTFILKSDDGGASLNAAISAHNGYSYSEVDSLTDSASITGSSGGAGSYSKGTHDDRTYDETSSSTYTSTGSDYSSSRSGSSSYSSRSSSIETARHQNVPAALHELRRKEVRGCC